MVEISLPQVCRENMCCVTTTLVFFVIAQHSSSLSLLLQQIKEYELQQAEEWCAQSGEAMAEIYKPKSCASGSGCTEVERMVWAQECFLSWTLSPNSALLLIVCCDCCDCSWQSRGTRCFFPFFTKGFFHQGRREVVDGRIDLTDGG